MLLVRSCFFSEMAAGEADENVFEAGLPGGEMQQLGALLGDGFEQRRNGDVGLADGERDESIIGAGGFDAGEGAPGFEAVVVGAIYWADAIENSTTFWPPKRSIKSGGVPSAMVWP